MITAWKQFNYRLALRFFRAWARPTVGGVGGLRALPADAVVYVLANRSLADILLLDLVCRQQSLPSPLAPLPKHQEARRFFFLNRPTGLWRRNTMLTGGASARLRRLQAKLAVAPDGASAPLWLAPVSIFWGRAANKDRSWIRALFSEGWAFSSRLRRLLILLCNRRDILVELGEPLPWHEIVGAGAVPDNRLTRRTARLLRVKFRNQMVAALGPDLSHRRTLVAQLLNSSAVAAAINAEADANQSRGALQRKARKAAFDIAADMSYPAVRFFDRLLTWFWHRVYQGVRVSGVENLRALAQTHSLVYAPCHRSHIDYLLLSHVLHNRGFMLPHIASGDNLDLPLIGRMLRGGGAFFMRRSFTRDRVYTAVFSEYLYQVLRRGHSVEYFVEGGRSRTGRLLPPRLGLLQMTLDAHERGVPRPIAFVPVYVGYEKVMEAASYVDELGGLSKKTETIGDVLRGLRLARQFFGTAQVCFGPPIALGAFLAAEPREHPARALGARIVDAINQCAFANATNLVALATLSTPRQAIEEKTLVAQIALYQRLIQRAPAGNSHAVDDAPAAAIVRRVERLGLLEREPAPATNDVLGHDKFTAVLMTWYRNNVAHMLAAPAFVACLVVNRRRGITRAHIERLFETVFPYLANELRTGVEVDLDHWLTELRAAELLTLRGDGFVAATDGAKRYQLKLLANTIMHVLERFYMATSLLLNAGSGTLDRRKLLARCRLHAERISKLYGIGAPEFADPRLFEGLAQGLVNNGIVRLDDTGKLHFDDRVRAVIRAGRGVIDLEFRQAIDSSAASDAAAESGQS